MYPRKYNKKKSINPPYVTVITAMAATVEVDQNSEFHGLEVVSNAMTAMVAVTNKTTTQPNIPYPASIIDNSIYKFTNLD